MPYTQGMFTKLARLLLSMLFPCPLLHMLYCESTGQTHTVAIQCTVVYSTRHADLVSIQTPLYFPNLTSKEKACW